MWHRLGNYVDVRETKRGRQGDKERQRETDRERDRGRERERDGWITYQHLINLMYTSLGHPGGEGRRWPFRI